ncbi:unnamed protein product [Kuraishia capsulata CBS 1993]|uniref:Bromo domain-containing protein n=1 Tax=Kuraishia capsulata CBS 1993 TaxID=1382522 RepID=W6MJ72_9ASCO|nr:uncharacterized protein KUCA_T00000440001 [Kuraishia capsulata CBS 1993]CDK24477.1 unnamed protein product [Kuraishia capsulata CBS 1993]
MPSKRKGSSANSSPTVKRVRSEIDKEQLQQFLNSTVQLIANLRDDNNNLISKDFNKLPSNKLYPDYYQLIENPISIHEIRSKIASKKYLDANQFLQDVELMANNANFYNDPESDIALDAKKILEFVDDQVKQLLEGESHTVEDDEEPVKTPAKRGRKPKPVKVIDDYSSKLEKILKELIDFKIPKRGKIAGPFMEEVDGELYPDYYTVIEEAMAFNTVLDNLDSGKYSEGLEGVDVFERDVNLIFQNSFTYNEEESLIFQDATILKEHFVESLREFKSEIEEEAEDEPSHIKIKLKPGRKPSAALPKITLNLKKIKDESESVEPEITPKKKRGRKPKRLLEEQQEEVEIEEVIEQEPTPEPEPEKEQFTYRHHKSKNSSQTYIQDLSISTLKTLITPNPYYNSQQQQPENTIPQYFEFLFPSLGQNDDSLGSRNYSINVPSMAGTVTILTTLNESLLKRKYTSTLLVNGEKVTPSPSVTYTDSDEVLKTKFEVKLGTGLNSVQFTCSVPPVVGLDENGKLPPRSATNPTNPENMINETVMIWINVAQ